ncbi:DUF4426 domain-containing protein [Cognatilysobacter segetis]|uniref:DUF4426 domain-containing protein n=1 Tax=Cognatilysobacter segetis TaxID=2492394 RepID=UPI00105FEA52|nr:DUF4426 domain-containing protein [Lysobacter segetis]
MRTIALALLVATALAGCGRDSTPATASASAAAQEAQARVGDVTVHASVVQTSTLDASIAQRYGLERSDRIALLLVSARRDGDAPLPPTLTIEARASAGSAAATPIALRPLEIDGSVDYVGTVDIAPPETLRFDVVVNYGTAASTLQFTRDFYPR